MDFPDALIFSTAPLTSDLSRCNVCLAIGVVAAACCPTSKGKPLTDPSCVDSDSSAEMRAASRSAISDPASKYFSSPSSAIGWSTSAARFVRSRFGPPHGPASPPRWCDSGKTRDARSVSSKFGSAHLAASRETPPDVAPDCSGTSTMSGAAYPPRRSHRVASVIGIPPG